MVPPARDFFGRRREGYYQATHRPLNCLVFLLPLILCYELGLLLSGPAVPASPPERVAAFYWLLKFLRLFAAVPAYLLAPLLTAVFLLWHGLSRDRQPLRWPVVGGMVLESLLLSVPLLILNKLVVFGSRTGPLVAAAASAAGSPPLGVGEELLIALTAGIYEEMFFRGVLISLGRVLLVDVLKLPRNASLLACVLVTALLFAAYHHAGAEPFTWPAFLFRTGAGLYLGGIFVMRGFGIAVGVHSIYDLIVTLR